ncbi:class I SAM-dependent methyltransferase [Desulforhopalus sp. 52FAK]
MSSKLKDLLASQLKPEELGRVVGSYDIVGDIAIIIIPEGLLHRQKIIGEAILEDNKNVQVVARRVGHYGGEYRTIALEVIAGEERKETHITEFGVRLLVNVETTYYSVRSGNERRRIASLVGAGERVLVMFSGVGPYPLLIAKHSEAECVIGIEKNPQAHEYALKNIQLNKNIKNVQLHMGDVGDVGDDSALSDLIDDRFDRIVMPLPTMGYQFLDKGFAMLKPAGGTIHYYEMAQEGAFETAVLRVKDACRQAGRVLSQTSVTRCGHCGPRSYRICVDAQIV